ncbi:hypothetical protein ACFRCI_12045 [Streptomyces sp. NPDC056638]|uniref:hypothetical protein n=1 Tax=Streptomyces sp. NPDC056638 TaxID=3345887 RepID=UPI003682E924
MLKRFIPRWRSAARRPPQSEESHEPHTHARPAPVREQNSGAVFFGDDGLDKSGSERRATESAPPSAGRHHASCTSR